MSAEEVELRYKVQSRESVLQKLTAIGAEKRGEKRVVDHWFLPPEVTNQTEQDEWFDSGRGCGIRIREVYKPDGSVEISLGAKRVSNEHGHKALAEAEVVVSGYQESLNLLNMMGRREFLTIDKTRMTFTLDDCEVVLDDIAEYGIGVEIEYKGDLPLEQAMERARACAERLGLTDADAFEKSLTVDAMHALARY
jgi:adenylate cyclase class IV